MSDTCSCPYCGRPAIDDTGDAADPVDHAEAAPGDTYSREANLTPVSRRREAASSR